MSVNQIPFYLKISNILKEEILNGVYQVGELLPTENELEKKYVTSRTTIRNALGLLEREGLVVRKQGKGTVVMETKTIENMNYITSFAETLKEKNIKIETGSLNVELVNPPQKVASLLNLKKGEKIYLVQRLRIADGIPIAYMNNYIIPRFVPNLADKKDQLYEEGLYQIFEKDYKLRLHQAVETIEAYNSGPLETTILQVPEKTALFHALRVTYLEDGTPFEVVISVIRAGKYQYRVFLKGRPPQF